MIAAAFKKVKVKIFVCSDYKFIAEVQGKPNRAGCWCPFCDLCMEMIKNSSTHRGTLWSIRLWDEKLNMQSNVARVNCGVVKLRLLPTVEAIDYLIAILHQLLGTGNDIRKEIIELADTMFENWTPELLALNDEVIKALNDRDTKREARTHNKESLTQLEDELKQLRHNHTQIGLIQNTPFAERYFIDRQNILKQQISHLKQEKDRVHLLAVTAGKEYSKLNDKLKTMKGDRHYSDKPIRSQIYVVFKSYSIVPQQYHGGDFVGPHVRKLMEKADEICAKIADIFKQVPFNERRIRKRGNGSEVHAMNDQQIDKKMRDISDLLMLADSIYSQCHAPPGTLIADDLDEIEEVVRIFSLLWRSSGLSATIKVHIIEAHLMTYLHRFKGLGSYEESFIERAHQEGVKMERRSANVKAVERRATLHSCWERLQTNPLVEVRIREYDRIRAKRKREDTRVVIAENRRSEKKRVKVENRQSAKTNQEHIL